MAKTSCSRLLERANSQEGRKGDVFYKRAGTVINVRTHLIAS